MNLQTFYDNFELLAEAPNGVQKLRQLIIQLAVQGKLVPQNPNDVTATLLIEQIQKEKKKLVKDKGVKETEKTNPINAYESLHNLPTGWQWIRLGQLVVSMTNGIYKPESFYSPDGIGCLRMYNINAGAINLRNLKRIRLDRDELEQYLLKQGDLLVNRVNSRELVGKAAVIEDFGEPLIFESKNIRIRFTETQSLPYYINLLFRTNGVRSVFEGEAKQTTGQASINQPQVANILVPLPPLEEQRRIIAQVDHLMTLCDELEKRQQKKRAARVRLNQSALDHLLAASTPDDFNAHWQRICDSFDLLYNTPETLGKLRQSILQLAVQGKLVPQDLNDEPAAALLEKIKAEKERLISRQKIQKDKKHWTLSKETPPWNIPKNWHWVRLQEIFEISRGGSPRPSGDPLFFGGNIPWITVGEITKDSSKYLNGTRDFLTLEGQKRSRTIQPNDLLLTNSGATLGVPKISLITGCINDGVALLRQFHSYDLNDYAYLYLLGQTQAFRKVNQGMGQPNLNTSILAAWFFPLPPLEEQKRIIAKVDQLMKLCDEMETKLTHAQSLSESLMASMVRHIFSTGQENVSATLSAL